MVTGATGFVGARLVETLALAGGVRIRALVHTVPKAVRIARFNIDLVDGSITDAGLLEKATQGCDVVFHCAIGNRQVNVQGTENLAKAAAANKVGRLVHVSTAAVYGNVPDGPLDESAPRRPSGWNYADEKLQSEEIVLNYHKSHGLPVTILQLANVYGPWGTYFTIEPLRQLREGRVVVVNDGQGLTNATYVDDVVQALLLAASRDQAVGQIFLIRGPGRVTRRQFLDAYQNMLGVDSIVSMPLEEVRARFKQANRRKGPVQLALKALRDNDAFRQSIRQSPAFALPYRFCRWATPASLWDILKGRLVGGDTPAAPQSAPRPQPAAMRPGTPQTNTAKPAPQQAPAALDQRPLILPNPVRLQQMASKVEFRIDKAQKLLGYNPQFDLDRAMKLTEAWARWFGLIPQG